MSLTINRQEPFVHIPMNYRNSKPTTCRRRVPVAEYSMPQFVQEVGSATRLNSPKSVASGTQPQAPVQFVMHDRYDFLAGGASFFAMRQMRT